VTRAAAPAIARRMAWWRGEAPRAADRDRAVPRQPAPRARRDIAQALQELGRFAEGGSNLDTERQHDRGGGERGGGALGTGITSSPAIAAVISKELGTGVLQRRAVRAVPVAPGECCGFR
jgi:hypothetical protein